MTRWTILAALLSATAALAGCAGGGPAPEGPFTDVEDPLPTASGHDHRDPAAHRFAHNAELLDHQGLREFGASDEVPVGAHALARQGDLLAVAVNAGFSDEGQQGVHLFDLSEPERPRHLSYWQAEVPVKGDRTVAFAPDGKTLFLGYEGKDVRPGIAALDVSDPAAPRLASFWSDPQNRGPHTVSSGLVGGATYVFALTYGIDILRYDAEGFHLEGKYLAGDEPFLLDAPGSSTGAEAYARRSVYGHDMTLFHDPETGKDLLLVAYAYQGLKVVDLSVPSLPVLLARWMPPADTDHRPYVHGVVAERRPDGELLVVVGAETYEEENWGVATPVWVLDATAALASPPLAAPVEHLGTWRNPGGAGAGDLLLSAHFFRLRDGLLSLSHYHGGVWGIDLRTREAQSDPAAFAYILPVPEDAVVPPAGCCGGHDEAAAPMVFDVEWGPGGIVYAADQFQGLLTVRLGPPPEAGP